MLPSFGLSLRRFPVLLPFSGGLGVGSRLDLSGEGINHWPNFVEVILAIDSVVKDRFFGLVTFDADIEKWSPVSAGFNKPVQRNGAVPSAGIFRFPFLPFAEHFLKTDGFPQINEAYDRAGNSAGPKVASLYLAIG